jgi:hypothetical protein
VTDRIESGMSPAERVHDIPRILRAMRQAVREALLAHKRAGNPVAIWRNDRVEWVKPEDIPEGTDST